MKGNIMKLPFRRIDNEDGSVLIISVLFMIILTLIGVAAMNTGTIEIQIAANEKFHKIAFQNADSGIYATPKFISACLDAGGENVPLATAPGILLRKNGDSTVWVNVAIIPNVTDGTFYKKMMGYSPYTPSDPPDTATDLRMEIDSNPVEVDVRWLRAETLSGGGAEFSTGAEGLGSGSAGSAAVVYSENSFGQGPADSASNIFAVYRKIIGMPGGL
jgi:hypothetical protein